MQNLEKKYSLISIPEYTIDDVKRKREEMARTKTNEFNQWFRTQFICYFTVLFGICAYTSPYFLHFIMRDYTVSDWSETIHAYSPVWLFVSTILALLKAPHNVLKLRPSMKDAEFLVRQEKCLSQNRMNSLFVRRQINAYCLSVYKRKNHD